MHISEGLSSLKHPLKNPIVTFGNFDGVHLGHQALLAETVDWAKKINGTPVAMTFDPHPIRVLNPAGGPPLLTVLRRKKELIAAQGIDELVIIRFTPELAALSAEDFVDRILLGKLGITGLVVGYDASIGRNRQGTVGFLTDQGREKGFEVRRVGPVVVDGETVSSTRARRMIQDGNVEDVIELLGRPYQVGGRVIHGHSRGGRVLGYPTANLRLINEVIPALGVYAVRVTLEDGTRVKGATNVGLNPTFEDKQLSVETFLLDFEEDLYEQFIRLDFFGRIRNEMKFDGPQQLADQISRDVIRAREILG